MQPSVKVIKASKSLQVKAGKGEISEEAIQRAEETIEKNDEDFISIADGFLLRLADGIDRARNGGGTKAELIAGMTKPVMELKANAAMFKYDLVTSLAAIMLDFLETIEYLDDTVVEIVAAHHKTLTAIVHKKMKGDGGQMGPVLQKELAGVCARYLAQKKA